MGGLKNHEKSCQCPSEDQTLYLQGTLPLQLT
jgi:hypothetical protein